MFNLNLSIRLVRIDLPYSAESTKFSSARTVGSGFYPRTASGVGYMRRVQMAIH
jgi:hypothetical protein